MRTVSLRLGVMVTQEAQRLQKLALLDLGQLGPADPLEQHQAQAQPPSPGLLVATNVLQKLLVRKIFGETRLGHPSEQPDG